MSEKNRAGLIATCVILGVTALGIGAPFYCGWHFATFGDADDVRRVRFLRDGADVRLLSSECVSGDSTTCRLSLLDAGSGQRLARLVRDSSQPDCQPAVPGRLWCRDDELGIYLVDSRSLAVVADQADLLARSPLLASGLSGFEPVLERAGRGLVVGTNAGLKVRLDPTTLEASLVAEPAREEVQELDDDGGCEGSSLEVGGYRYSFEGNSSTDRLRLGRYDLERREEAPLPVGVEAARGEAAGADTFLKAYFVPLVEGPARTPVALAGPPGFLVVHVSSLDEEHAKRLLSRVDERGRIVWTTELPRGRVMAAERLASAAQAGEERAVLVVGDPGNSALSFRLQDGAARWLTRL